MFSCFLTAGRTAEHVLPPHRGSYLYVVEGGEVEANGHCIEALGAIMIIGEQRLAVQARHDAELLLVEVGEVWHLLHPSPSPSRSRMSSRWKTGTRFSDWHRGGKMGCVPVFFDVTTNAAENRA